MTRSPRRTSPNGNGLITTGHLAAGEWRLRETAAPQGYLVDDAIRTITVTADGLVDGEASHTVGIEDDYTKLDVSKRDITNEEELPGAQLDVLDSDGEVVASSTSTGEPHRIDRLKPGDYTLVEEMTPHTYDKATEVPFTVLPTGEVQTVVMHDEPISITAEIDKRQEIADPVAKDTEANGDDGNFAEVTVSDEGEFEYSVDFRSTSSTWVDEFTVTDEISAATQGLAVLDSITTPVAGEDYDGKMNVWYKTNLTPADHVDESGANATLSDGHDNPWPPTRATPMRWAKTPAGSTTRDGGSGRRKSRRRRRRSSTCPSSASKRGSGHDRRAPRVRPRGEGLRHAHGRMGP